MSTRIHTKFVTLAVLVSLCIAPMAKADQEIGEGCDIVDQCREGAQCIPTPWIGAFQQRCVPEAGNPLDAVSCQAFYSESVHDQVKADLADTQWTAQTYGAGVEVAGVGTASAEIGTVYGTDGRYGCYTSSCTGVGFALGISVFGSFGKWKTYDDVAGDSGFIWAGGGLILTYVLGPVLSGSIFGDEIGFVNVGSVGLGLDIGQGIADCSTSVLNIISLDNLYVDVDATGGTNGSSLAPFNNFAEAYGLSESIDGSTPTITLRASGGSQGVINAQEYTKKVTITADQGPVTLAPD